MKHTLETLPEELSCGTTINERYMIVALIDLPLDLLVDMYDSEDFKRLRSIVGLDIAKSSLGLMVLRHTIQYRKSLGERTSQEKLVVEPKMEKRDEERASNLQEMALLIVVVVIMVSAFSGGL